METGTQIAYIPTHANGDINHPDVEFGFVVSARPEQQSHFCRYWTKNKPGILRTVANSELTPDFLLKEHQSVPQDRVISILNWIHYSQLRDAVHNDPE